MTQRENGSRREWWRFVPDDKIVVSAPNPADGSPGHGYCLADPGRSYVVFAENTGSTNLRLGGRADDSYRVTRFDPRTAQRTLLNASAKGGTTLTLVSPDTEDWIFEVQRN